MIRKLCTILLSAFMAVSAMAQTQESTGKECATFGPQKGQWEISLGLGKSGVFYNENNSFLLPNITPGGGLVGLPNGSGVESGYLNPYLNINGFNNNSLVNIVGVQAKYFFQDCWSLSFSGGLNTSITPKKDYIESTEILDEPNISLPEQKYINAQTTNNWYVNIGVERYFKTKNTRIHPYVGGMVGFQMARVDTREPYTGKYVTIDPNDPDTKVDQQVYVPAGKVGQMYGIKAAGVAGVEYSFTQGMFIALECQPFAYRYDVIQIAPQGFDHYNLSHHNIKFIDTPMLRLGFRF